MTKSVLCPLCSLLPTYAVGEHLPFRVLILLLPWVTIGVTHRGGQEGGLLLPGAPHSGQPEHAAPRLHCREGDTAKGMVACDRRGHPARPGEMQRAVVRALGL